MNLGESETSQMKWALEGRPGRALSVSSMKRLTSDWVGKAEDDDQARAVWN